MTGVKTLFREKNRFVCFNVGVSAVEPPQDARGTAAVGGCLETTGAPHLSEGSSADGVTPSVSPEGSMARLATLGRSLHAATPL